ncbi:MAG: hypothetical protein ACKOXP_08250 [Flavobacteriales bacterium]
MAKKYFSKKGVKMINAKVKEILTKNDVKFTLIIGSGFHYQFYKKDSILSSWNLLLESLSPQIKHTGDYHLDFEKIIEAEKTPIEDSNQTENRLLKKIKKEIVKEQLYVLNNHYDSYTSWIFNPKFVSDVISLNFDEIPERLLKNRKNVKLGKFTNVSSFKKRSQDSYAFLSTRHRDISFGNSQNIRFWHPHGVISNNKSMVLGHHKYAHILETTIAIRNHHMQLKRKGDMDSTWYQALLNNPVIILGAGMSSIELDLWFGITSRNRVNENSHPIFQMRECGCKNDAQHQWFEPLFVGKTFSQQWQELEKLFNKKRL